MARKTNPETEKKRREYAAAYAAGVPVTTIARRAKITTQAVHKHLRLAGVAKSTRRYTPEEDRAVLAAIDRLGEKIGRTRSEIYSRLNTLLYTRPKRQAGAKKT